MSASLDAERRLGFLLNELSHLLRREFERRMQEKGVGLTRAQWLILRQLALRKGCRQRELADAHLHADLRRLLKRQGGNGERAGMKALEPAVVRPSCEFTRRWRPIWSRFTCGLGTS